jgi:hypothetical protein
MSRHHPLLRVLLATAAFAAGGAAGLFGPSFIAAHVFGESSYESVLFIWLFTVPGGAIYLARMAWRWTTPGPSGGAEDPRP